MGDVTALASFLDQAVTSEKIADGRASRPSAVRMSLGQKLEEFLRAPGGVMATSIEQGVNEIGLSLVRASLSLAGTIFKTADAVLLVAADPLISSLSADAIVEA